METVETYQVWHQGKVILETEHEKEALILAKSINGRVVWCLDHCGISIIYPNEKPTR
jgi:calcineurin-like phosphoesterase family protein